MSLRDTLPKAFGYAFIVFLVVVLLEFVLSGGKGFPDETPGVRNYKHHFFLLFFALLLLVDKLDELVVAVRAAAGGRPG